MNFKKITIALAILLTMFAVNAIAQTTPPGCNGLPNQGTQASFPHPTIPGCTIYFNYCYDCGDPVNGTGFTFYIQDVTSNCEFPPNVYGLIETYLTQYSFLVSLCPQFANMPPCGSGYKDIRITKPYCWHITNNDGTYYATPCNPLCPAFCVSTYRYCYEPESQTIMFYLVGQIPAGDATDPACGSCAYYTLPMVLPVASGTTSDCYHICQ